MKPWYAPAQLALLADPIDESFMDFHHGNPHVYRALVSLARQWKDAGHERCSMDMLFHRLRWDYGIETRGDTFRLNDHFTSRYARLISANEPDLAPMFATRQLRGDYP